MIAYPVQDAAHAMMLARAAALDAYATLESSICETFTCLTGTARNIGGLVFFRMVNTRSRLVVLETLLKDKHPEFAGSRNSLIKHLTDLDSTRNRIIHWTMVRVIASASVINLSGPFEDAFLQRPDHWWLTDHSERLSVGDVLAFTHKADYVSRCLNMFNIVIMPDRPERLDGIDQAWRERFLSPLPYPPPEDHPLYSPPLTWQNPRQSSQG